MGYRRYDKVLFITHDLRRIVGKLITYESGHWWVQVKESFNYIMPIEVKGRIVNWIPQYSTTIDHYVPEKNILNLIVEDETVAA